MLTIRSILHPTDFSDISSNAFQMAGCLARDYGAQLHVLHVATTFEAYKREMVFDKRSEQYLANDWEKLGELQFPGVEVHRCLEEGEPAEQILHVAASLPCDFIVMGSHGRSGLDRLLLGSVAENVVRGAACQVIVVKAPVAAAATPERVDHLDAFTRIGSPPADCHCHSRENY